MDYLWGYVVRSATVVIQLCARLKCFGQAEISEFDPNRRADSGVHINKYVMRLDVSVDYFVARQVLYGLQQLVHDQCYLGFRKALFVYVFLEVATGYVFHYEVKMGLAFYDFLDLDNVFV